MTISITITITITITSRLPSPRRPVPRPSHRSWTGKWSAARLEWERHPGGESPREAKSGVRSSDQLWFPHKEASAWGHWRTRSCSHRAFVAEGTDSPPASEEYCKVGKGKSSIRRRCLGRRQVHLRLVRGLQVHRGGLREAERPPSLREAFRGSPDSFLSESGQGTCRPAGTPAGLRITSPCWNA